MIKPTAIKTKPIVRRVIAKTFPSDGEQQQQVRMDHP
jgi:hypothetical protein